MPTLAEIEAAARTVELQRAEFIKPQLEKVHALLTSEHAMAIIDGLGAVELPPGEDKNQVGNIRNVLASLKPYFETRITSVTATIAELTPPPAPPEGEGE